MMMLMLATLIVMSKRALLALKYDDAGGHQFDEKRSFNIMRKDCVVIVLFQIYHDLIR